MILHSNKSTNSLRYVYVCPECHTNISSASYELYMSACDDHRLYHARLGALTAARRVTNTTETFTRWEGVFDAQITNIPDIEYRAPVAYL